jgi:hypothetical protein
MRQELARAKRLFQLDGDQENDGGDDDGGGVDYDGLKEAFRAVIVQTTASSCRRRNRDPPALSPHRCQSDL